jgi:dsRNA-specific ribonuclease
MYIIYIMQDVDMTKTSDGLVFNPFNKLNTEITTTDVEQILSTYGVHKKVNNIEIYKRAFVHKSYTKRAKSENEANNITIVNKPDNCVSLKSKSNERLEFMGDGILEAIVKYYLYKRFPKENEGFMTEKKIYLVKNESIGKFAFEMNLHKWFLISHHAEEKNTRINLKKLGCLFEAFIGALFLDMNKICISDDEKLFDNVFTTGPGFQFVQIFIENVMETHVDWTHLLISDDNYKNILQVKLQRSFKTTPDYLEMSNSIDQGFTMGVFLCLGQSIHTVNKLEALQISDFLNIDDIKLYYQKHGKVLVHLGTGVHKIKKKAEKDACESAISWINNG